MQVEFGGVETNPDNVKSDLAYLVDQVNAIGGLGVFYWEPEFYPPFNDYNMGAWAPHHEAGQHRARGLRRLTTDGCRHAATIQADWCDDLDPSTLQDRTGMRGGRTPGPAAAGWGRDNVLVIARADRHALDVVELGGPSIQLCGCSVATATATVIGTL